MPTSGWPGPDGIARRTSPLTVAAAAIPLFGGLFFFFISAVGSLAGSASTSSSSSTPPVFFLLGALAVALTGVAQVVRWATTTYSVFPTELVVDEGVLTREHRVLPFARIQQADTHQNVIGQVMGLTELKVDVAGASGSTQVTLRLLDKETALALRDYVLRRRTELHAAEATAATGSAPAATLPPPPPGTVPWSEQLARNAGSIGATIGADETPVLRLGPGRLVVGAITHSTIVLGVPLLLAVAIWVAAILVATPGTRVTGLTVGGIAVVVALGAAFIGFALVVQAILGQYGFTVSLAGDDIHLRYGLLETRNLTVPRRRVQQVTLIDNPLRRAFGLVELHLHTAAAPGGGAQATTRFTIPVLASTDVDSLLTTLMGDHRWRIPELAPRPPVARRRAIVRRTVLLALVVAVPAIVLAPLGPLLLLVALLGIPWGQTAHRRAGHGTSASVVALSHGALHHRIDLVPIDRIQSVRSTRTPMQRWSRLATILIDTAGASRAPFLWDLEIGVADDLRRQLPRRSAPQPR